MEQFCRALHPDLDLSPTCLSWFRQATAHCAELIIRPRMPGTQFWRTVKSLIFPDRSTALLNQKIPISIHPNRLSLQDCHSLFLDIVNDYILRAPRYSAEATTNVLLWQILYSLMGIMALGSLLVSTIFAYRKFGQSLKKSQPKDEIFTPEKCARAVVNRNLRMVKYELHRLHVRHLAQPEELFAPDGTTTLVVKMSSKLNFVDGMVSSSIQSTGRLYRMHELIGKKKPDYKTETVAKVMRFLNNYSRKLRILMIFDEDPIYEELLRKRKKSPPKYLMTKCAAPAPALRSGHSILSARSAVSSPRSISTSCSINTSRSNSPMTQCKSVLTTSPRVGATQIPRNFQRRNSTYSLRK